MSTTSMRARIIELAQVAIANRGYSAFSFRELALELGIKSASIHYHFPTKAHLGVAVAKQYRERFTAVLEVLATTECPPVEALQKWVGLYRHEVNTSQRMTICTMLAAEMNNLPGEIQAEMVSFYALNIDWIRIQLERLGIAGTAGENKARQLFALLQGALMGAKSQGDPAYFEAVLQGFDSLLNG